MKAHYSKDHWHKALYPTPFFERQSALSETNAWHDWKGKQVPDYFECSELEYFAIRNATAVFDLSPMSKYRIEGPDAEAYLNRLVTRKVEKIRPGRVGYSVWCNDQGKVVDDGTIFRLDENVFMLCAQERQYDWLMLSALGFDIQISEQTEAIAALAVQGPTSCAVLKNMGLSGIENLKPFGIVYFPFAGTELMVSRTGFTGDLGYELWIDPAQALALWDALFEAGKHLGIRAMGTDALEIARIEAAFIQAGVDFSPANQTVRKDHDRSPFELGLDWLVHLDKDTFTGRKALMREKEMGSRYRFVKLDIDGNKPATAAYIYDGKRGKRIGVTTSAIWAPSCKQNIALATLEVPRDHPLDNIWAEVFYQRELAWTTVWEKCREQEAPFWSPPRRSQTPPADY